MKKIYYTVLGWKDHKFDDIEEAKKFCDSMYITCERFIEKHEVECVPYVPDKNRPAVKDIEEIVAWIKDRLCADDVNLIYRRDRFTLIDRQLEFAFISTMVENRILSVRSPYDRLMKIEFQWLYNDYVKNYLRSVFEKVPVNNITIAKIVTDYSLNNCIAISIDDIWPYLVPEYVNSDSVESYVDYSKKYGHNSLFIMFKGDTSIKDIVIDWCMNAFIDVKKAEYINVIDFDLKNYIKEVIDCVFPDKPVKPEATL